MTKSQTTLSTDIETVQAALKCPCMKGEMKCFVNCGSDDWNDAFRRIKKRLAGLQDGK